MILINDNDNNNSLLKPLVAVKLNYRPVRTFLMFTLQNKYIDDINYKVQRKLIFYSNKVSQPVRLHS